MPRKTASRLLTALVTMRMVSLRMQLSQRGKATIGSLGKGMAKNMIKMRPTTLARSSRSGKLLVANKPMEGDTPINRYHVCMDLTACICIFDCTGE